MAVIPATYNSIINLNLAQNPLIDRAKDPDLYQELLDIHDALEIILFHINPVFANMYIASELIVTVADTNAHEILDATDDGWTVVGFNDIVFPTGGDEHYLTLTIAGRYEVIWSLSAHVAAGGTTELHAGVMIDGVATRNAGEANRKVSGLNDTGNWGSCTIINCPNGDEEISMWISNDSSNDVHVEFGNMCLRRIADPT